MAQQQTCSECSNGPCRLIIAGDPNGIVVIGETPGKFELSMGRPFAGLPGKLLRGILAEVAPDVPVYYTYAIPGTPSPECRDRLLHEVRAMSPKSVLLCGNEAIQTICPGVGKISKIEGRQIWSEELGVNCIPTFTPQYIVYDPGHFRDFVDDIKQLTAVGPWPPAHQTSPEYTVVSNVSTVLSLIRRAKLYNYPHAVCDLETTGLNEYTDRIVSTGIAFGDNDIWIIPDSLMQKEFVRRNIKALLEDTNIYWAGQNGGQFDAKFLRAQYDIDWRPQFDTMLAHYALDERQTGHDLKTLARRYFQAPDYADEVKDIGYNYVSVEKLYPYQAYDLHYTWRLVPILAQEMSADGVARVHDDILAPGALALGRVEQRGVTVDLEYLDVLGAKLKDEYDRAVGELQEVGSRYGLPEFNPNSPKQVAVLLFDKLGLKSRGRGTDHETLEALNDSVGNLVLDCRLKSKLQSTYVDGLRKNAARTSDGRVRADFCIFGTRTGRLSARDPNLQNIPQVIGPMIRDAFIATPGWVLIEADYSQLELRVAGWFSQDPYLIKAYQEGLDLHTIVASSVFRVPESEVTPEQRYVAKYVDFGILYGRGAPSLAHGELKCSVKEAQKYIDNFLAQFVGLREWIKRQQHDILQNGYTTTAFGRKRRFPFVTDDIRGDVLRQCVNTPIQGTASDFCLQALTALENRLDPDKGRVLLTVHDSILFEARPEFLDDVREIIYEEMEDNIPLESNIPFKIDQKVGDRWGSLTKVSRASAK